MTPARRRFGAIGALTCAALLLSACSPTEAGTVAIARSSTGFVAVVHICRDSVDDLVVTRQGDNRERVFSAEFDESVDRAAWLPIDLQDIIEPGEDYTIGTANSRNSVVAHGPRFNTESLEALEVGQVLSWDGDPVYHDSEADWRYSAEKF